METNSYWIKFGGKSNIPEPLQIGVSYKIVLDGEVVTCTESNNHDNTVDKVYKFLPILCEIVTENGETIKAKDNRQNSVKIRKMLWAIWSQRQTDKPFDQFYDEFTNVIIKNADNIADKLL